MYSRCLSSVSWDRYRARRNFVVNFVRKAKINFNIKIYQALDDPAISSKTWWGMEISVSRIFWRSVSQVFLSYPKPKANVFNDYFASQAMIPNNALLKFHFSLGGGQTLCLLSQRTGEQKVCHPLYSVDISKPSGCDRVSNKIIRLCSANLYEPFTSLINTSFRLGQKPSA